MTQAFDDIGNLAFTSWWFDLWHSMTANYFGRKKKTLTLYTIVAIMSCSFQEGEEIEDLSKLFVELYKPMN